MGKNSANSHRRKDLRKVKCEDKRERPQKVREEEQSRSGKTSGKTNNREKGKCYQKGNVQNERRGSDCGCDRDFKNNNSLTLAGSARWTERPCASFGKQWHSGRTQLGPGGGKAGRENPWGESGT